MKRLLITLMLVGCSNGVGQQKQFHEEIAQIDFDGVKVLIDIRMQAWYRWWEPSHQFQWWLDAEYHVPDPYELRASETAVFGYRWWDDMVYPDGSPAKKDFRHLGHQSYVAHTIPHRGIGKFWLSNRNTSKKILIELPIWK